MDAWIDWLVTTMSLPQVGLSTVFFIAFIASTLVPLGSEPAVFALVKLNPEMFWPAIGAATVGATLGGVVTYWMGYGAERAYEHMTHKAPNVRALRWLERFGAKACLLSWLPIVGGHAGSGSGEQECRPVKVPSSTARFGATAPPHRR